MNFKTLWETEGFPIAATDGTHNPNPLYMLIGNMRQSAHSPRAYAGNLGGSPEKIVASPEEAREWVAAQKGTEYERKSYTLIEIRCIEMLDWKGETTWFDTPEAYVHPEVVEA